MTNGEKEEIKNKDGKKTTKQEGKDIYSRSVCYV